MGHRTFTWKPKSGKITKRRKIHYNLLIYKDCRDCLESLLTRVDFGSIDKALELGLERGCISGPSVPFSC